MMAFTVRPARTRAFGSAALLLAALLAGSPAAAQYRLGPGDKISVTVVGAPEISSVVEIDIDGHLRLPVFDSVPAAGKDVAELQASLREAASAQVYRRFGADGAPVFIAVEPRDVYVSVVGYRPVYVSGAVASPGEVSFRPGMTVRAALAAAGGAGGAAPAMRGNPLLGGPRLRGDIRTLSFDIARLMSDQWRLEAELAEDPSRTPPDPSNAPIRGDLFENLIAVQRERLEAALAGVEEQRLFYERALAQTVERLEILREQQENVSTAAEFDREEQERVQTLFDRGVVPISRLLDVRRAQLLSSTRLLETQNNLERVQLEDIRVRTDTRQFEENRRGELLASIQDVRAKLETSLTRLAAVREELALTGQVVLDMDTIAAPTISVTLHREEDGRATVLSADMETRLRPGDALEVSADAFDLPTP